MNALNYLKLDLRIMKSTGKYILIGPIILCIMLSESIPTKGLGYLFFFFIVIDKAPFIAEGNQRTQNMYYMLPSKISSMVFGRFIFLILELMIVWVTSILIMMYFYHSGRMNMTHIGIITFTGFAATIIVFCQFPIYYKFGLEKGKFISMALFVVPAFIVMMLPKLLNNYSNWFNVTDNIYLLLLGLLIMILIGYMSYTISCAVCKKKEL